MAQPARCAWPWEKAWPFLFFLKQQAEQSINLLYGKAIKTDRGQHSKLNCPT
jgi:hypothetical protein